MFREAIEVVTGGRGFVEVTDLVQAVVDRSEIECGLCHVFIRHTSAALLVNENADPDVLADLETWLSDQVRDGDRRFRHRAEGPDDMAAHLRSMLTETSLVLPVADGLLALGTWQGVFVWEHRKNPHTRTLLVSVT